MADQINSGNKRSYTSFVASQVGAKFKSSKDLYEYFSVHEQLYCPP